MKKNDIIWRENGWTVLQEADAAKHILEFSCFAQDGKVTEVRKRHNDGEEEKMTKKISEDYALPMAFADFKAAFLAGKIKLK